MPVQFSGTVFTEKASKPRSNDPLEYLRCELIELSIDADRLTLSVMNPATRNKNLKLGIINYEEVPALYR